MRRSAVVMPDGLIVNIVDRDTFADALPEGAVFQDDPQANLRTGGTWVNGTFTPAPTTFEPRTFADLGPREVFAALFQAMVDENVITPAKALAVRNRMLERLKR